MNYKIVEEKDKVILEGVADFELSHIFECGQCFRWNREVDGSYTLVAHKKILNVAKEKDQIIFNNTNIEDFYGIWKTYFDLGQDYGAIKKSLCKNDPVMERAIEKGYGIRILKQDEWETLISFIISSNRGIPLIKKSIEELSEKYGRLIGTYKGRGHYAFPEPEALLNRTIEEIRLCRTGYRAKYILDAAAIVGERQMNIYNIHNLDTDMARKELLRISGVGPKVADCILLFSMGKFDAFPIDVWVKRVMEYFYLQEDMPLKVIQDYGQKRFGEYAGFAQQYLFYYARELGIGK
ncbi:N-glycosylase/DNA lyase [Anaerosolibacter carboniphilus]|uniref:DNA-(apurinic or apyrimidinic site) lyase n=1 Tax=Anaerosolibacter carboniphilus TaxID=1417629 RepID=A0A841KW10_9FIRM|nr:DNA glycosylase [Anaerosolibacter carboniphilus]MBB6217563.1 N-glycosylase/DNA lyase [Anaerosolibacter carboniphilus]